MYQFYPPYQIQQQFPPWYNQQYVPQAITPSQPFTNLQHSSSPSNLINPYHPSINKDPKTLSNSELIDLLDNHTNILKELHAKDQQQQIPILIDAIIILIRVPRSILASTVKNEFFSLLRTPLIDILHQWCHGLSSLSENEFYMFRSMTKLIRRLIKATDDIKLIPLWLSDSTLLEAISNCITDIATSGKFLDERNKSEFKYFTRLIDAYIKYQQRLNDENHSQKDTLLQLLDPILHCLTSSYFINTFANMPTDKKSMTTIEKFFLVKCPAFFTSYNGSRLEKTIESLLSTMLSQYVQLLDHLVPSTHNWKRSTIQAIRHLLEIINHGANQFQINAKLVSSYPLLIDDVLKLVNEPIFYNNLHAILSNLETTLMNTAISFLVNMISEPTILAYIKQCQVANVFLRLTSCQYEPLVFNVYALLAYTTREEDIKAMHDPGRLLATIIKSLKTTLNQTPNDKSNKEQLLETLKGLVQHDQIKDEVIKQNALPFLLECTNILKGRAHILILEILWSLTFREESALALRSNDKFLNEIQTISTDSNNEPLKKAADGLVWKLIREPAFLKKVAKQEEEEEEEENNAKEVMETIVEEIVNNDGQKQLVTKIKPTINSTGEQTFQYDIMISYCHADKELTYKIHKFLVDQGFKIWIDLDNMYGPAMNAMADAVENSEFVIMCMSDSYKQSTYCQAEAEYAFKCKRRLIPLIMRQGYRPDGWLGFMIGSRIYVDFGRFDFEIACEKLMTEISLQRKQPLPLKPVQMSQHETPTKTTSNQQQVFAHRREKPIITRNNQALSVYTRWRPMSNFIRKPITEWTESDVLDFLFTQRLIQLMPLCETMDGRAFIQLYKMCISRSSKIYALLDDELKSTYKMKLPIGIYTRFLSAMEQRSAARPSAPLQKMSELPVTTVTTTPQKYVSQPPITTVTTTPQKYVLKPPITTVTSIPQKYVLQPPITSVINNSLYQYPLYPDRPYDLIITSDAPALEILRAVQYYAPNFEKMSSILAQNSGRC